MRAIPELVTDFIPQLHALSPFRGEYQPPHFQTVDLPRLNDQSFRELQRQVYREGRQAHVLVDPWHGDGNPEAVFPSTDQYRQERDQFIADILQKGVPFLIFEPSSRLWQIAERVAAERGVVHTIGTFESDPTPVVVAEYTDNYPFWSQRALAKADSSAWSRITQPLKDAGVKRVTIGGRLLVLHEVTNADGKNELEQLRNFAKGKLLASEWLDKGLIPSASVGFVARRFLVAGFDVSLSPISSPAGTLEPTDLSSVPHMQNFY